MQSPSIKPVLITRSDKYHCRLLSVKLTGSFSSTEYISFLIKPATVFTVLPYKGSDIKYSPSQCLAPKELPGLLLSCETLEQCQEFHYNSSRRAVMPVTVCLENSLSVEADTYIFPVESIEEEYWDDWELPSEEPVSDMSIIADEDFTDDDSVSADLPIEGQKSSPPGTRY
ncbi:hypothetical protein FOXB_00530 [Fusarium oxysporum f. sp. conglutinans Fo5176]|uniref:Uncharacterized protein n=1 Tax=Fusarium oxysporum (strain Fo5176) TaxID=660025 RepID=F9F2A6_FUSOF|nr:hypothetical protein FOXB_00530 [Fusarium oxysporum f. sp. conglutinans Fo5176]